MANNKNCLIIMKNMYIQAGNITWQQEVKSMLLTSMRKSLKRQMPFWGNLGFEKIEKFK